MEGGGRGIEHVAVREIRSLVGPPPGVRDATHDRGHRDVLAHGMDVPLAVRCLPGEIGWTRRRPEDCQAVIVEVRPLELQCPEVVDEDAALTLWRAALRRGGDHADGKNDENDG